MGGCPDSGLWGSAGDRSFGAEPVIEVVPGLEAAGLIQFIRTVAELFFKIRVPVGCECSRRHRGRMLVLHCLMLSQFFGNALLLGSQFLCGGVRKLASSPQMYTTLAHISLTLFVVLAVFASLGHKILRLLPLENPGEMVTGEVCLRSFATSMQK